MMQDPRRPDFTVGWMRSQCLRRSGSEALVQLSRLQCGGPVPAKTVVAQGLRCELSADQTPSPVAQSSASAAQRQQIRDIASAVAKHASCRQHVRGRGTLVRTQRRPDSISGGWRSMSQRSSSRLFKSPFSCKGGSPLPAKMAPAQGARPELSGCLDTLPSGCDPAPAAQRQPCCKQHSAA